MKKMDGSCFVIHLCCLSLFLLLLLMYPFGICITLNHHDPVMCIPTESDALLRFKLHLDDPSNRLSSWNASSNPNCCLWYGVVCSHVTSRVIELHLSTDDTFLINYFDIYEYEDAYEAYERSVLGGEISESLVELKHLTHLDLSGNHFGGMQIPTFLSSITSLTYLNLSGAGFYGKIPPQIGNLSNLLYLDLSYVANGFIPNQIDLRSNYYELLVAENLDWLSRLSSLQYLDLGGADLSKSSDWLHIMQALPFLEQLRLGGCALYHHKQLYYSLNFSSLVSLSVPIVPKWIFGLNKLVSLTIHSNYPYLSGSIPDGIQNLTLLENLDLSSNSFSSSIPNWLYALHHLKFLNLKNNQLGGTISDVVKNLTSLTSLDLSYNQFEGNIPTSFGKLNSLTSLDLSYNQFEGNIPNSFKNLCNLKEISFSNMKCKQQVSEIVEILTPCISIGLKSLEAYNAHISGYLTGQFEKFKNLVTIDFRDNSINGTIPSSFQNLSSLRHLELSNNQLQGNPFKILGAISTLSYLDIDDNHFQGVVQEDDLGNLTSLRYFSASGNNLTLKVDPNWQPNFQVEDLAMGSWQLGPSFPSWIQSQRDLQALDMSNTGISDSIPTGFWESFPSIDYFNLSHNCIHGELQITMKNSEALSSTLVDLSSNCLHGKLSYPNPSLYWLDLSNNSFSGTMNDFLCQKYENKKRLLFLNLASNNLSGAIPDCWKMWSSLVDINLQSNHFIGKLPLSMKSLVKLQSLNMRNNMLSGEFPLVLNNNRELISLDLGENNFNGVIPAWFGDALINLKILRLRTNEFSGTIPNTICRLKFLQDLDLAQNHLSGNVPKCLHHLSAMLINKSHIENPFIFEYTTRGTSIISVLIWVKGQGIEYRNNLGLVRTIDLSHNRLSGRIPEQITRLSGLIFFNLSKNQLSGGIPQSIGNMVSLEVIDISSNQLSGEIPATIANLSFLSKLDVSNNHLEGKIPTGTQLQTFDASDFIGNNLCGPPLLVNCSSPGEAFDSDHNNRDSDDHGVNWLFVSVALGYIVGFWGVVAPLIIYKSWRYAYFRFIGDMWYKLQSRW